MTLQSFFRFRREVKFKGTAEQLEEMLQSIHQAGRKVNGFIIKKKRDGSYHLKAIVSIGVVRSGMYPLFNNWATINLKLQILPVSDREQLLIFRGGIRPEYLMIGTMFLGSFAFVFKIAPEFGIWQSLLFPFLVIGCLFWFRYVIRQQEQVLASSLVARLFKLIHWNKKRQEQNSK